MKHSILCLAILAMPMLSQAAVMVYSSALSGPTSGTGFASATVDSDAKTLLLQATFSGLSSGVTVAHIHSATTLPGTGIAGVAVTSPSLTDFPVGVTAGVYALTFDMTQASSYNPAFVTANGGTTASAFAALQSHLNSGRAYLNIHTTNFTSGEIRGFLVPEPGTTALAALAGASLLIRRRRSAVG